jgi:hypothetical protein
MAVDILLEYEYSIDIVAMEGHVNMKSAHDEDAHNDQADGVAVALEEALGQLLAVTGACGACTALRVAVRVTGRVFASIEPDDPKAQEKRMEFLSILGADAEIYAEVLRTGGPVSTGN